MNSNNIPRRKSKIAEDYARKERMEPPKAMSQEAPLVAEGKITARQHPLTRTATKKRSPA